MTCIVGELRLSPLCGYGVLSRGLCVRLLARLSDLPFVLHIRFYNLRERKTKNEAFFVFVDISSIVVAMCLLHRVIS